MRLVKALFTDFWTCILVLLLLIFTPEPIASTTIHTIITWVYIVTLHVVRIYNLPRDIRNEIEELKKKGYK